MNKLYLLNLSCTFSTFHYLSNNFTSHHSLLSWKHPLTAWMRFFPTLAFLGQRRNIQDVNLLGFFDAKQSPNSRGKRLVAALPKKCFFELLARIHWLFIIIVITFDLFVVQEIQLPCIPRSEGTTKLCGITFFE